MTSLEHQLIRVERLAGGKVTITGGHLPDNFSETYVLQSAFKLAEDKCGDLMGENHTLKNSNEYLEQRVAQLESALYWAKDGLSSAEKVMEYANELIPNNKAIEVGLLRARNDLKRIDRRL